VLQRLQRDVESWRNVLVRDQADKTAHAELIACFASERGPCSSQEIASLRP
jgi:hypothetical protein